MLQTHLEHLEFLEQHIRQFDDRIEQSIPEQSIPQSPVPTVVAQSSSDFRSDQPTDSPLSWQPAMALLDTIPGVARRSAQLLKRRSGH